MRITKLDVAIIAVMAFGTAIAVYFAANRSLPAAVVGLFAGAMGWVIPAVVWQFAGRRR